MFPERYTYTFFPSLTAIGYSTNLIAQESNLIVLRGDGDPTEATKSVYQQMFSAFEEFFPEVNVLDDETLFDEEKLDFRSGQQTSEADTSGAGTRGGWDEQGHEDAMEGRRIKRVNTGVSSIVGRNNGERPGGFVLVIEGTALGHVSFFARIYASFIH